MTPKQGNDSTRTLTLFGQTITRMGSIYAIGMMSVLPLGILSVAVTTRYLVPSEFGHLAVMFATASFLTIISGLGVLQGTMIAVYGMADGGEEADGSGLDAGLEGTLEPTPDHLPAIPDRKRLLGSGLLIILGTSTILCGTVALLATPMAAVLLGDSSESGLVRIMALSAWTGGIWRVLHQIPRMERRPVVWSALQVARPVLVVALTIVFLVNGGGIHEVLAATALGTVLAIMVGMVVARRSVRFAPQRQDLPTIWGAGRPYIPLVVANSMHGTLSVFVLAAVAPAATVGIYQAASRMARIPAYFADGFLAAWAPLERSPISLAAKDRKGHKPYLATVFSLFWFATLALVVVAAVAADQLIQVVGEAYRSGGSLIPILCVAAAAQAVFRGIYRSTGFRHRRYWFAGLHVIWLLPYALVAMLLVPVDPVYAVVVAELMAAVTVSAIMVHLDRREGDYTPYPWTRLFLSLAVAAMVVAAVLVTPVHGLIRTAIAILALLAFPLLLVAVGVISRAQLLVVRAILRSLLPFGMRRAEVRRRLRALPAHERAAVQAFVYDRCEPDAAAERLDVSPAQALARLARGLRHFAGYPGTTSMDAQIGAYVLFRGTTTQRDDIARALQAEGVDPLQLHVLDGTMRTLGRARAHRAEVRSAQPPSAPSAPVSASS